MWLYLLAQAHITTLQKTLFQIQLITARKLVKKTLSWDTVNQYPHVRFGSNGKNQGGTNRRSTFVCCYDR